MNPIARWFSLSGLARFPAPVRQLLCLPLILLMISSPGSPALAAFDFGVDVMVNDGSIPSAGVGRHTIALRGSTVSVVWADYVLVNPGIRFARSTDAGATFEPSIRLDDGSGKATEPTMWVDPSGQNVFVAWRQQLVPGPARAINFARSVDGGASFDPPLRLDSAEGDTTSSRWHPVLCGSAQGAVYAAWVDTRMPWGPYGECSIFCARSEDFGSSFAHDQRVTICYGSDPLDIWPLDLDVAMGPEGNIYLTVTYFIPDMYEALVSVSRDGGSTFTFEMPPALVGSARFLSSAVTDDGILHVLAFCHAESFLWEYPYDILYFRSFDEGRTFHDHRLMDTWPKGVYPGRPYSEVSLSVAGSWVALAWSAPGNEIRFAASLNSGQDFEPAQVVNDVHSSWVDYPAVSGNPDGGTALAWIDYRRTAAGPDIFSDHGLLMTDIPPETFPGASPVPGRLALYPPFPNPIRDGATIAFDLPADHAASSGRDAAVATAALQLAIYDVQGRLVRMLVDERRAAGTHRVEWDGTDAAGCPVSSGVCFARLTRAGECATHRLVVVR